MFRGTVVPRKTSATIARNDIPFLFLPRNRRVTRSSTRSTRLQRKITPSSLQFHSRSFVFLLFSLSLFLFRKAKYTSILFYTRKYEEGQLKWTGKRDSCRWTRCNCCDAQKRVHHTLYKSGIIKVIIR